MIAQSHNLQHGPHETVNLLPPTRLESHHETNHRITNSLQLLSALLNTQIRQLKDPAAREVIDSAILSINAIAGVHRQLCHGKEDGIVELRGYLLQLTEGLQKSYSPDKVWRHVNLRAEEIIVSSAFATSMGIVITEVVLNASKHAYAVNEAGDIDIDLIFGVNSSFRMEIRDHGTGFETGQKRHGKGSQIIEAMSRRIGARHAYHSQPGGTCFVLEGYIC